MIMLRLHYKNVVLERNLGLVSFQYILTYYGHFTKEFINNYDILRHHQCAVGCRLGNATLMYSLFICYSIF